MSNEDAYFPWPQIAFVAILFAIPFVVTAAWNDSHTPAAIERGYQQDVDYWIWQHPPRGPIPERKLH